MAQSQPPARPFDLRRSLQLDALIIQLDQRPGRIRREVLQLRKSMLECRVPAFGGAR